MQMGTGWAACTAVQGYSRCPLVLKLRSGRGYGASWERLSGRTEGARDDLAVARSTQTALHLFLLFCGCSEGL